MALEYVFGSGTINCGAGSLKLLMGGVDYSVEVEIVEVLDTSVFPMTVLERRVAKGVGVMTVQTAETSNANLLADILTQASVSVTFTSNDGSKSISMSACTVTAGRLQIKNEDWMQLSLTFKSLSSVAPVVNGF